LVQLMWLQPAKPETSDGVMQLSDAHLQCEMCVCVKKNVLGKTTWRSWCEKTQPASSSV